MTRAHRRPIAASLGSLAVALLASGCLAIGTIGHSPSSGVATSTEGSTVVDLDPSGSPTKTSVVTAPSGSDEPTNGPTNEPTNEPTNSRPAPDGADEPPTVSLTAFRTPSGNIECAVAGGVLECAITQYEFIDHPQPDDCELDWFSNEVQLDSEASIGLCRGGIGHVAAAGPNKAVLHYDTINRVGDISCRSEESGLSCWNLTSHKGFTLSRTELSTF